MTNNFARFSYNRLNPFPLVHLDYYPFGMMEPGRNFNSSEYRFGFDGQEKVDEISGEGNHNTAEFWEYDTRLGRRWNIDPVIKPGEASYAAFGNNPISFIDPSGKDSSYFLDQKDNPDNKRIYTADVYMVKNGDVVGKYSGSTFPNDDSKSSTIKPDVYDYNNRSGHDGGNKKGLNIVNEHNARNAPGTNPEGNDITMTFVNVHSGVSPEEDPAGLDRQNRGSEGCLTIAPSNASKYFDNFNWTNSKKTTGNSTGKIIIVRGSDIEQNLREVLEVKLLLFQQSLPNQDAKAVQLKNSNNTNTWDQ